MSRFRDDRRSGRGSQSSSRGQKGGQQTNPQIEKIIQKIEQLRNFSDYPIEDFSKPDGDANLIAREFKKSLKPTQMRKFFDTVYEIKKDLIQSKKSWNDVRTKFYQLFPMLHYAQGRNLIPKKFLEIMTKSLQKVETTEAKNDDEQNKANFLHFSKFFEAIIAYHKFHNPNA